MRLIPRKAGNAAEKRVAKATGAKPVPGSGSRWHNKGDLRSVDELTEVKTTTRKSYALKLTTLQKIEAEAAAQDRNAAFIIEFNTPRGKHTFRITRI